LFQIIDALEKLLRNFSKEFLLKISKECEKIDISLPLESLGKRKKFFVERKWLLDFLNENFIILSDFKKFGERFLVLENKLIG
jgi:hypothetical protein